MILKDSSDSIASRNDNFVAIPQDSAESHTL